MLYCCKRLIAGLFLGVLWVSACSAQNPAFTFTAIPSQDETELLKRFGKVAAYLEKKLGVPAVCLPVNSYEAAVDAFVAGRVQLAWFGGYTGVKARRAVPGSEVIAQGAEDVEFKSYFIAHISSGLKPSKDFPREIAGKSMVFGSPLSTSGRLIPEYWIKRHLGKWPEEAFSRVSFSGDHSSTLDLVQSGVAEVGALDYTVFEAAKKAGKADPDKVTVIWETPPFPDYSFIIRGDVDAAYGEGFRQRVKQAILDLDDQEILKSFARSKFIPATNEQYEFIEELVLSIEGDGARSPSKKPQDSKTADGSTKRAGAKPRPSAPERVEKY
jgi:phosphonate transport system substrate-binding protein